MVNSEKTGHREKLRESFLRGEEKAMTDEALLELLLSYAIPRKDVQPLARQLISELGSLSSVLDADLNTLCKFKEIKKNSAILLKLTNRIRSRYAPKKVGRIPVDFTDDRQACLFDFVASTQERHTPRQKATHQRKVITRKQSGLFGKAVLKEAIDLLPRLPDTNSIDEIREYLRKNLHYSAQQTRRRYANYIVRRMFPNGYPDEAIRIFAKHFNETRDLQEVCFYRFIKAEPLMQQVVEEVLLPGLGNGRIKREKIRDYLAYRFPSSQSIKDGAKAVVEALVAGGIAKADRVKISFSYREISIPAFAFVIHSEFSSPGMYDIGKLDSNREIRTMLWNPDRILPSLYELRNKGLISKISEIDNVRQFTVKWYLNQLVEKLVYVNK